MNGLRETCHCGDDLASHYLDRQVVPAERLACLVRGCQCKRYVSEHDPKPKPGRGERPKHARWCQCARCVQFDAPPEEVTTDPWPPAII